MSRARADVYYQRCAGLTTGLVSLYCQVRRRPFVFAVANDRDLDGSFERDHGPASRILYRFGMEHSDRIVVQTEAQERLLEDRGGGPSIRVSNVCSAGSSGPRLPRGGPILWAGSFDEAKKRPGLLLHLAGALPHRSFVAIGAGADLDEFLVRARARPNVRYEGIVPWSRMDEVYERIDLVVSTAAHEGFNNVMLEAWARGIPVVSLDHDPDEVICRHGLGAHSRSLDRMAADVEAILGDPEVYARSSAAALDYVRAHHDPDRILDGFAAALAETVRRRRSLPSRCRMLESRRFLAPPAPRSSVRDRSR